MINICAPALIYLAFSLTQIIIDTFQGLYNTAFMKIIVMIIITILLNALCVAGMSIISWIIVFIPFIFMSVIVAILLYVFGLDIATGTINLQCSNASTSNITNDSNTSTLGGNLIFSTSESNIPTSTTTSTTTSTNSNTNSASLPPSNYSSDPAYESFISK
jgi:hypothetical protein